MDEAAKVAEADRCTLFLVDRERGELWSKVAPEKALEVLAEEARRGQIDGPLLRVFVEARVWHETARPG